MATIDTGLSRFKIVNSNQMMAPGKCAVCGKFSSGHFVDFGLELDFYGVVYFCVEDCFTELANLQGYHSPAQHKMVMAELEAKRFELNDALDRIDILEGVLEGERALGKLGRSRPTTSGCDNPESSDPEPVEEPVKSDPGSPKSKSGSVKQANEQGHPSLFADDELKGLLGPSFDL